MDLNKFENGKATMSYKSLHFFLENSSMDIFQQTMTSYSMFS